jgi:hypothetical protein
MPTPLDRAAEMTFDDLETVFSGIDKRLSKNRIDGQQFSV